VVYDSMNFEKDVIEQSRHIPVLVDFWAEWCGPCKVLGPVLERVAEKNKERFRLVKINTEQHPQVAMQYRVQGIPNVKLFVDGQVVDEFTGALPEHAVEQWLDKTLPSPNSEDLTRAEQFLAAGNEQEAGKILRGVIEKEPGNARARLMLADMLLFKDPEATAKLLYRFDFPPELMEKGQSLKDLSDLLQKVNEPESLPDEAGKDVYIQGLQAVKEGEFEKALQSFINVIRENRYYDDDGARKACVALFKYLGEDKQLTREYRTRFSRSLYV